MPTSTSETVTVALLRIAFAIAGTALLVYLLGRACALVLDLFARLIAALTGEGRENDER